MMHLNGYFGNASTWLLLGFGWLIISIVTSLIFGAIARIDGRKGEENETLYLCANGISQRCRRGTTGV